MGKQQEPHWNEDFPIRRTDATRVNRREFAKFLCLVSGGLAAGSAYVAIKSNFFPSAELNGKHFICKKEEVPVGGTRTFVIAGSNVPYILIHLENGELHAYEQKCTHLSCAVFYKPGTEKIECPCHNGWFDAKTGENIAGPPPRPLPKLQVFLEGNEIYVKAIEKNIL